MYRSREWIFERIRRDRRLDPAVSGRALAVRYRVPRNSVAKALASAVPAQRKKPLAAYSTARDYVARRRPELVLEAKQRRRHLEGTVRPARCHGD